jgi:hypothetical protein
MTRKFNFSIATTYIRSEWKEVVELEFDDDATEEEIEKEVEEAYQLWLYEHNYGGWSAVD